MAGEAFSHVDPSGKLQMVDVSGKATTKRTARARCFVEVIDGAPELDERSLSAEAVQNARLAGIQATKQTSTIIPLCHPLALDHVDVDVKVTEQRCEVTSSVSTVSRTGVEMEALTGCLFCALSLSDALGHAGVETRIGLLTLLSKTGGKSDWGQEIDSDA